MDSLDIKLKLLAGLPMEVHNLGGIKPLTLKEIARVGYSTYSQYLSVLVTELSSYEQFKEVPDIDTYSILDLSLGLGGELMNLVQNSLSLFIGGSVIPSNTEYLIEKDGNLFHLDNTNFKQLVFVLEFQNMIKDPDKLNEDNEFNPKDEKAAKIIEKIKKARKALEKAKKASGETISFADLISAVSTRSNTINKFSIWDLTLYQLYDEYNRLQMIDDYNTSIQAMLAGAEKIKLKHWSQSYK